MPFSPIKDAQARVSSGPLNLFKDKLALPGTQADIERMRAELAQTGTVSTSASAGKSQNVIEKFLQFLKETFYGSALRQAIEYGLDWLDDKLPPEQRLAAFKKLQQIVPEARNWNPQTAVINGQIVMWCGEDDAYAANLRASPQREPAMEVRFETRPGTSEKLRDAALRGYQASFTDEDRKLVNWHNRDQRLRERLQADFIRAAEIADVATADVATADVATADVATADVATADVATADVATADVATANVATANVVADGTKSGGKTGLWGSFTTFIKNAVHEGLEATGKGTAEVRSVANRAADEMRVVVKEGVDALKSFGEPKDPWGVQVFSLPYEAAPAKVAEKVTEKKDVAVKVESQPYVRPGQRFEISFHDENERFYSPQVAKDAQLAAIKVAEAAQQTAKNAGDIPATRGRAAPVTSAAPQAVKKAGDLSALCGRLTDMISTGKLTETQVGKLYQLLSFDLLRAQMIFAEQGDHQLIRPATAELKDENCTVNVTDGLITIKVSASSVRPTEELHPKKGVAPADQLPFKMPWPKSASDRVDYKQEWYIGREEKDLYCTTKEERQIEGRVMGVPHVYR